MRPKTEDLSSVFFFAMGKGFDPEKRRSQDGIGINQIEARVFILKGIMNIDSEIGGGTRIEINLPILNTTKLLNPDLPVL